MWLYRRFGLFIILDSLLRIKTITVKFPLKDPHYVALNRTLILDAQVIKDPAESVTFLTWDCKNSQGEVRVVTDDRVTLPRASVTNRGTRLVIREVTERDYGSYTFTVTDKDGRQKSDSVLVVKSEEPPKASLVLKCSVRRRGAPWDSPEYSWLVDGEEVNEVSRLSEDGSALYLSEELGRSYACRVESGQGPSETQTRAKGPDPEEKDSGKASTLIAVVVIETIIIALLLMYLLWRCFKNQTPVV